ncbi:hypothetical protein CVT26_011911 [Gymnopilus dilepis]|uniref:FAR-17a/AIG1-like protein n=1 Tax=Gymnopilus dilepis TaxID=231916 RepID=A0A409WNF0_9AGAR|nr:hypothetical protein CVT26_011911 [Gymnopilus dilepis]
MKEGLLAALIQGLGLAVMSYGYQALQSLPIDNFVRDQHGGHFQYLTIQGLALAWMTMLAGLINTICPATRSLHFIKRCLALIALPLSIVISILYWSLLLFMPGLILQSFHEEPPASPTMSDPFRVPFYLDLALHACPASFLLLDFFLFEKKYNKRDVSIASPAATIFFSLWYGIWVEYCGNRNEGDPTPILVPYPFLTDNAFGIRVAIYTAASVLALLSFRLINFFHG